MRFMVPTTACVPMPGISSRRTRHLGQGREPEALARANRPRQWGTFVLASASGSRAIVAVMALILLVPAVALAGDKVRMLPAEGEGAKYWPRWRGPSGQGNVPDGSYPDQWSETE